MSRFIYATTLYFCDSNAYKRIELALNLPGAFPRRGRDDHCDARTNNYGEYKCDKYEIFLDGDCAFISFKDFDLEFVSSIMDPLADAFFHTRGSYELRNDETEEILNEPVWNRKLEGCSEEEYDA